jgi:hypothetical protein
MRLNMRPGPCCSSHLQCNIYMTAEVHLDQWQHTPNQHIAGFVQQQHCTMRAVSRRAADAQNPRSGPQCSNISSLCQSAAGAQSHGHPAFRQHRLAQHGEATTGRCVAIMVHLALQLFGDAGAMWQQARSVPNSKGAEGAYTQPFRQSVLFGARFLPHHASPLSSQLPPAGAARGLAPGKLQSRCNSSHA